MTATDDDADRERHAPAERLIREQVAGGQGVGKPLSSRALLRQRSVESYLRGEVLPRYITRAAEIERRTRDHERELRRAHRDLREDCRGDRAQLAARWRGIVQRWDFREVNRLIAQHNDWYPIERNLPMNPRTGDYVPVSGRDYRRQPLDAAWALERFPA